MRIPAAFVLMLMLSLFACKEKQNSTSAKKEPESQAGQQVQDTAAGDAYFSIKDFFNDQWKTRKGIPYTLLRVVNLNGQIDSSFVDLDSTLWAQLRSPFDAADISDKKYMGQYNFEMFDDESSQSANLNFDAKTPELFLQKMYINADQFSHLVRSVYMETKTARDGYIHNQKLTYIPDNIIQIVEYEKATATPVKNLKIEYRYKY